MMKQFYYFLFSVLSIGFFKAQNADIFESYASLSINGGTAAFYDMQATTSNTDLEGANLGSFGTSGSIVFSGGEMKTWKNNGGDVTGGKIYYRVYTGAASGSFSSLNLNWMENLASPGDQRWGVSNGTTNILTGLADGTYTLEVYVEASTSVGTKFSNNSGNNYKATFTVNSTLAVQDLSRSKSKFFVVDGKLYTPKREAVKIQILDFSGRVLKTIQAKPSDQGVELHLPKKGNYLLKMNEEVIKFRY